VSSMLSLFPCSLLKESADLRITFADSDSAHCEVHSYLCALTLEHLAETVLDVFRSIACYAENMLSSPYLIIFLLDELLCRSLAKRTFFRSCISLMNVSAYTAYPFSHNSSLL